MHACPAFAVYLSSQILVFFPFTLRDSRNVVHAAQVLSVGSGLSDAVRRRCTVVHSGCGILGVSVEVVKPIREFIVSITLSRQTLSRKICFRGGIIFLLRSDPQNMSCDSRINVNEDMKAQRLALHLRVELVGSLRLRTTRVTTTTDTSSTLCSSTRCCAVGCWLPSCWLWLVLSLSVKYKYKLSLL